MDARQLFLEQLAAVHSAAVGGNTSSIAERTFGGLTDDQMRVRPRPDLNSLAWLLFHIGRAEDVFVNVILRNRRQVFDEGWAKRMEITRRDFGVGMTSDEVTELSQQLSLAALREYRDAVGLHTRQLVAAFEDQDWQGTVSVEAVQRAADEGAFGNRADLLLKVFPGRPRAAVLSGIAITHAAGHMGEANTVRTAGGFGLGV
jgi:hypothetical protein